MERLINIDNGGTLTDICVWDGQNFNYAKTLTTPFDLSKCLFDGLTKASESIFGAPDLEALLHSTKHIRYSTTQGTNALVERKGPGIGLVTDDAAVVAELRATEAEASLFDALIGPRVAVIDPHADEETLIFDLVQQVNKLTTDGAARIVVAVGDASGPGERRLRNILLRKFPRHLLGSVPVLYSWEFTADRVRTRRIWSGVINAFLHPTMERFLYNAEDRLREHRVQNPLLIYRNDGASSRVSKSVALRTYSSGPRAGLEGARALAKAYDLKHVLMIDVGGTTTDVNLLLGVLDPATYLDGDFALDAERSKAVILATVAEPLGVGLEEALVKMEAAYFATIAKSFAAVIGDPADTTIAAFGGAGPMSACGAARLNNVKTVLVPKLAAVFSAFGISFSDIGRSYEVGLSEPTIEAAQSVHDMLVERAGRDMFQEGHELAACTLQWSLVVEEADGTLVSEAPYTYGDAPAVGAGQPASLTLDVTFELPHASLAANTSLASHPAVSSGTRQVRSSATEVDEVQVYALLDQKPGATALGPSIVEGTFFTARVLDGWKLDVTAAGDLMLTDIR